MPAIKPLMFGLAAALALSIGPVGLDTPVPLGVTTAEAAATVSINIFFQPLASHGVWVRHSKYRYVFCPKVDVKWRPYSHGHWIYMKNYGWYFASDEPFAWAVYHYGRWFRDQRLGWCWVPGNAWAGAWVAWRRGNDYLGWAPLEPSREGFSVDVDVSNQEPPQPDWIFVPTRRFLEPRLDVAIVFGDQQPEVFQKTQFAGPVVVQNNIVVNNIIDVNFIQQQTNQQVTIVDPKPVSDPAGAAADASGSTIAVFAPQIAPPKQDEAPPQAVDADQAAQQLGNPAGPASSEPSSSASSEQPSSAASSSEAASSSAAAPSEASSSAAASASSEQPASSSSSEAAPPPPSSEEQPASSSSAEQPASSSSEAAPPSSSSQEAAPASSQEAAPASSAEQPPASSLACPDGYEIVEGKCVPIVSSAAQ